MEVVEASKTDAPATWRALALVTIIAAGLFLRLVNIGDQPLWSDEALTLLVAQWPLETLFLAPVDPTPGLYYALHKALLGPMVGVTAARSISLVAGTLLIPAAYFVARTANIPALLTAALVALSFPLIDYSQEARAYSLLVLLVTLSAGFFIWWARTDRLSLLLASLTFGLLGFYTHFVALFWIGPLVLGVAWIGGRRIASLLLLMAILAIPEVSRLAHYQQTGFVWLLQASPSQAANTLARAALPFRLSGVWAVLATLVLGWRAWVHRAQLTGWIKANRPAAMTLLVLLAMPVAVWLFGFVLKPIYMTRSILVAVPGFMLALALLLRFEHRLVQIAAVALYGATILITGTTRHKEDWRAIADKVGGDTILLCQPGQVAAMRHALGVNSRIFLRYEGGLVEVGGSPWPVAYFNLLSNNEKKLRALSRAEGVDRNLFPVWAVRTGSLDQLGARPMTLGQAVQVCDANRADYAPRYIAE